MCHLNDALACPAECNAKQNSTVVIQLPAGLVFAAELQNCQSGEGLASFPHGAGANPNTCSNDHGAQA